MRLCKHDGSAGPLDQRAHPPRRRFAIARKGEERPAEPRRDIAHLGRRALRGQRIGAGQKHGERPIVQRFKANIRLDVSKRQAAKRVKDEAELGRQLPQGLVLRQPLFQGVNARSEVEQSFRIEVVQRTCNDIAQALDLGVSVDQSRVLKPRMQVGQSRLAQAA